MPEKEKQIANIIYVGKQTESKLKKKGGIK